MYKHILVPTDGSPLSRAAVRASVRLAKALGARVTGLFVAPPATPLVYHGLLPVGYGTPKHNAAMIERAARRHLDVIERAAREAGVRCETTYVTSDFPSEVILEIAGKRKCDLIYMASHGQRKLNTLLLGSQTQKVLAGAKIPVLVHR
jgi:nucleotide-binding universal stress UspA family protein